jgi:hypothetical protein
MLSIRCSIRTSIPVDPSLSVGSRSGSTVVVVDVDVELLVVVVERVGATVVEFAVAAALGAPALVGGTVVAPSRSAIVGFGAASTVDTIGSSLVSQIAVTVISASTETAAAPTNSRRRSPTRASSVDSTPETIGIDTDMTT